MGLGPPVCVDCGVIAKLDERNWRCPNCQNDDLNFSLFMLSKEDQELYEVTTQIMKENRSFPE